MWWGEISVLAGLRIGLCVDGLCEIDGLCFVEVLGGRYEMFYGVGFPCLSDIVSSIGSSR